MEVKFEVGKGFEDAKVLVVAGEAELRTDLMSKVRALGASCEAVSTGAEALAALKTDACDFLIIDTELPDRSGFEVVQTLRTSSLPKAGSLPVLGLATASNSDVRRRGVMAGFSGLTGKPVRPEVLFSYFTLVLKESSSEASYVRRLRTTAARSALLDTLLDSMPIALFTKDGETGRYRMCNKAFAEFANLESPEKVVGRTDQEIFGEATAAPFRADDARVLRTGEKLSFMETATNPEGRVFCLHTVKTRFTDYDGREALLGLSVDRTAEAEKEQELARQLAVIGQERDRALAAEKAKSYFFSTVSHDIRTPLNAIVGYAQMLKLGIDDPSERKVALDSVLSSSNTLLRLINDVLDLSKLEAGRMEILPEPTNCVGLVTGVVDSFRPIVGKRPITLIADVVPTPGLEVDPQRLRQILFNLLGNAVKFTEKGEVRVTLRYEDGTLHLNVKDTGCGISEADLHKIAEPYIQVGTHGRHGGTGLGLAIVRQLVSRMRGRIDVESGLGVGTEFFVIIPNVKVAAGSKASNLSVTQRIRSIVSGGADSCKRILIVDDSSVNLAVLRGMLKALGHKDVMSAANGREALELMEKTRFDMVLTDMWMDEMDGSALVREVRARGWRLPVYAVTADVAAQANHLEIGFTGILLKPVTLEQLKEIVGVAASL